jgi:hypothetical protein
MTTMGALLDQRDGLRFVGRSGELEQLDTIFSTEPPVRVVHLHGVAGIGKSTLLREIARRGAAAGWSPRTIEGRDIAPTRAALAQALTGIEDEPRPLILFDTYERISGLDGPLRHEILRELSADTRVVFASRQPPDEGWSQDGWEAVTRSLALGPLEDADAHALLSARGVPDEAQGELVRHAAGSPLALELLAGSPGASHSSVTDPEGTIRVLVSRLTGAELDPGHRDVLLVASIARLITAPLLAEVLPDHDATTALRWLATRSFAEPLGGGYTIHELVRRAVRAELRHREPERERVLRRAIADHLYTRAAAGDTMLSIDLAHLLENPVLRWGYSWMGADRFSADGLRPGDVELIERRMIESGRGVWWELSADMVDAAPLRWAVVRDLQDEPAGFAVAMTPANAPAAAWEHRQLGPWLLHARDELRTKNAILWQAATVLDPAGNPMVQAMLGMIGVLRSGLSNPSYSYLPINSELPGALEFARALGARHLPELDTKTVAGAFECHLVEYGATGILGLQRDVVYLETGAQPPAMRSFDVADAVRAALRNLDRPDELARNPLATGTGTGERAGSVRETLRLRVDATFGEGPDERLLHAVMTRGYLDPATTHEQAADELHVSRATYFRKLRVATQRVCDGLAASSE